MKREQVDIIRQCEAVKDVIWFLRGRLSVDSNFNDDGISSNHIKSLLSLVNYAYSNIGYEIEKE